MQIKKTREDGPVSWTVFFDNFSQKDISDTVTGSLKIELSDDLDYPVDVEFSMDDCSYIELESTNEVVENFSKQTMILVIVVVLMSH